MKTISKILLGIITSLSLSGCSFGDLFSKEPQIKSLEIVDPQTKYYVDEEFVTPTVMATYEADSTGVAKSKNVTDEVSFVGFDSSEVGNFNVDVIYTEGTVILTENFEYSVIAKPSLLKIEVSDAQTTYEVGDSFVKPTVTATYTAGKNGKQETKDVSSSATFSGFNSEKSGTYTITVSYTEDSITKTTTYDVSVIGGALEKTKLKYTYDDYTKNNAYTVDSCPTTGNVKLLVIPIWFTDSSNYLSASKKDLMREDIGTAYFGSVEETGWNSVKTFYETESHGKLTLTGTVSNWYEPSVSSALYADASAMETAYFVEDAVDWYFANNPSDSRKNYDSNKDGYLDGVMCIYAYPNYSLLGDYDYSNFWAYAFWRQGSSSTYNPTVNCFFWASFDFMYGADNANSRTGNSGFHYGDTGNCNLDAHTYIHEMGHVFGLEDYYDYNGVATPAGCLTMQDYNVCGHDPYSVMALGWADPYIPTQSMDITIKPFQESGDVILLTPSWNKYDSPFDEYILIELYTPTSLNKLDSDYAYSGRPSAPRSAGIRVWHVDARLVDYNTADWCICPSNGTYVRHAMSNTYAGKSTDHLSPIGEEYYDFNILQYIRNSTSTTYKPNDYITSSNMFKTGDTFSMATYKKQFVNGEKLNNESSLGWTFKVRSCSSTQAVISVAKVS